MSAGGRGGRRRRRRRAGAGDPSPRPNRAIFGGGRGDATQSLIFSAGLGVGRDYLRASAPVNSVPVPDRVTDFASGSAGLGYSLAVSKVSFGASVSSSARFHAAWTTA